MKSKVEYTPELKAELDKRMNHYLNGGKMVTPAEMKKRIQKILKSGKKK